MDLKEWFERHWLLALFGVDFLLFLVAVFLWKPGTRPIAGLVFVFVLLPPLAVFAVLLEPG
jgi:hypothetical protein